MSSLLAAVEDISATLKATKKMPEMTAQLRKLETAEEVANLINSAWLTYGAEPVEMMEDGSYKFMIRDQDYKTFQDAMKYLWYKEADGVYTLTGSPYKVEAAKVNGDIEVVVLPKD